MDNAPRPIAPQEEGAQPNRPSSQQPIQPLPDGHGAHGITGNGGNVGNSAGADGNWLAFQQIEANVEKQADNGHTAQAKNIGEGLVARQHTPATNGQAYPVYSPQPQPPQYSRYPPPPPASQAQDQYAAGKIPQQPSTKRALIIAGVALLAVVLMGAAFAVGGAPGKFMLVGIEFLPFAVLAVLAFSALRSQAAGILTYIWLGIVYLALLFNSFADVLILETNTGATGPIAGTNPFKPGAGPVLLADMLLLALATLLSASMLLKPVRVWVAKIVPIDPNNFVHKVALSTLLLLVLTSFIPLIVLGGNPPLLQVVANGTVGNVGGQGGDSSLSVGPLDLISQFVWMVPTTLVAAGWLVARNWREVLKRLGVVRPTLMQIGLGVGLGVGFAFLFSYVIDPGIAALWQMMSWGTTNSDAFNQLMSGVSNPMGAVLVGVTAGVSEELAVRGLLQPRIGLLASNLVFTSLHAFQYGPDGLLSVFITGLLLGIIRKYTNTSTSAIVHGVYDFVVMLMKIGVIHFG